MINVKDQIYNALNGVCENTADAYPPQLADTPFIFYAEEQNKVYEWTDGKEQKARLRYRIEIWSKTSTSQIALKIDEAISKLGLVRTDCEDVPNSEYRCKLMRYEGIIDTNDESVYWNLTE